MRTIAQRQPISVKKIYDKFLTIYKNTGKSKLQDMTCEEKILTTIIVKVAGVCAKVCPFGAIEMKEEGVN